MSNLDESALFSAYNEAKKWARRSGLTDEGRVNRAFGIVRSGKLEEKIAEYATTKTACHCPDRRGLICKHRMAILIQLKANEIIWDFNGGDPEIEAPEGPELYGMASSDPAYREMKL